MNNLLIFFPLVFIESLNRSFSSACYVPQSAIRPQDSVPISLHLCLARVTSDRRDVPAPLGLTLLPCSLGEHHPLFQGPEQAGGKPRSKFTSCGENYF